MPLTITVGTAVGIYLIGVLVGVLGGIWIGLTWLKPDVQPEGDDG